MNKHLIIIYKARVKQKEYKQLKLYNYGKDYWNRLRNYQQLRSRI